MTRKDYWPCWWWWRTWSLDSWGSCAPPPRWRWPSSWPGRGGGGRRAWGGRPCEASARPPSSTRPWWQETLTLPSATWWSINTLKTMQNTEHWDTDAWEEILGVISRKYEMLWWRNPDICWCSWGLPGATKRGLQDGGTSIRGGGHQLGVGGSLRVCRIPRIPLGHSTHAKHSILPPSTQIYSSLWAPLENFTLQNVFIIWHQSMSLDTFPTLLAPDYSFCEPFQHLFSFDKKIMLTDLDKNILFCFWLYHPSYLKSNSVRVVETNSRASFLPRLRF